MTKRIEVRCYGCGETLDFTDSSCTKCGVMQVRLCECGKTVSAHADRCPACGAEMDLLEYAPSRRWMVVVLIVLVLAGVAYTAYRLFPGDPARERRRAFVEAADDYQAGRYSEAHLKFRRFIEKYDRDPRALYMLGISLHRLGREQDGVIFAREALDIDPSIEEAAVYLANHEFDRRNYDEARELCRQVLDHNPQYVGAHEILGKILTRPGFLNLPEAIRHLEFAARNQPQNRDADPEIYVLLGELNLALERSGLIEVDQDPRSATWIRQARESAAELLGTMDEADVHFFQARCDYALQNYGQAWIEIQKALNTGEKTPERRLLKAKLQWERQGRPEALRILDEISADSPDPEVLLEIVAFCRVQGLEERAARELASAHERHPNDVAVVLEVARDLAARGDFVAAEQELEALRVKHPEDERIIVALAETLFYQPGRELQGESLIEEFANREGPTSYAMIRWIDRLLDFEPGSPEAKTRTKRAARLLDEARAARSVNESRPVYMNFLRGKLYYRQRLYRDAREILRSVTSRAPDNISAHRLLAMVHQALGEADYEALELSVVLRIDGETPDLLVRRADAHFRDGSLRRSAADCKAALALAPRHTGASILLAQVLLATAPPDVDGAVECLRAAMAPEDAPVEVRVALARALMARGDLDDAESELDAARNLPTSNEARLLVVASRADLADLRSNSPFSAAAREIWTDHLKTHPGSMPSLLSFARILMNQGSYEQAKQWIGQAVELLH